MTILLYVFLAQTVVISFIVAYLKNRLDRNLIDLGIKQIEVGAFAAENTKDKSPEPLIYTVITHKTIKDIDRERILKTITKHSSRPNKTQFQVDGKILGGIMIKAGNTTIDCTLTERLRQAF